MSEVETCADCRDEIAADEPMIVSRGSWCAPSETYYSIEVRRPLCSDCQSRAAMLAHLGIDPGRHGENLKIERGGFQWSTAEQGDR